MPLHCEAGWCRAEFISFCLQKTRRFPAKGTVYQIAETGGLTLALVDGAGRVRHLDAAPYVEIETPRAGHAAVTIALAQATLAKLGARGAAIEVGALVTLTPRAVPGDRSPQGIEELREASGPLRALGADLVDGGAGEIERARGLVALVNTVPRLIDRRPGAEARLWTRALERGLAKTPPARLRVAAREYERCWADRMVQLGGWSVHECLSRRHDRLMEDEVKRYWRAADPGS